MRFPSIKIAALSRLAFFMIWLAAAAALAGLLYWGKSSKATPRPQTEVTAKTRETSSKKAFDHREIPQSSAASRRQTPANHGARQGTETADRHNLEPRQPATPGPATFPETHENRTALHLASPDPDAGSKAHPVPAPPDHPSPVLTPPVARVAIVIDDFGVNLDIAKKFLEITLPITFSILPHQRFSKEIAQLAHEHHRQVVLHLPMEPQGFPKVNPGRGALLVSMSEEAVHRSLNTALDSSPHVAGMNNHMGSRFTENPHLMRTILEEAKKRGLYFLDSYTSPRSVAASVARQLDVAFLRRDIFLDNSPTEASIRAQLRQLIRRAKVQGSALAIGHPHESTLRAIEREAGQFEREKVAVVPAGELLAEP